MDNKDKVTEDIRRALILKSLGFQNSGEVDRLYLVRDKQVNKSSNKGDK